MLVPSLLAVLYFLLFSWIIWRGVWFRIDGVPKPVVLGAFYIKLIFGFLFWAVYTFHYSVDHGSDAFSYFEEAKLLNDVFHENPVHFFRLLLVTDPTDPELLQHIAEMDRWNRSVSYGVLNDNPTIIKFNAIVLFFSLGYYHTHTLFMGFVCFSGLILILRFFEHISRGIPNWLLLASVILPPSLLFWGGGVMKEGLLIFGLGILLYSLTKIFNGNWIKGGLLLLLSIFLLLFTKAYVLIAFSPGLIFLAFVMMTGKRGMWIKFAGIHIVLFAFVFTLGYWVNDYDVLYMFQLKQKDFYNLVGSMSVGSLIQIPPINNTADLVLNAPTALFNTYFRPHLLEATSATFWAAAIENLGYGLLILLAIVKFKKPTSENLLLALMCLSFVVGLGFIIGLITPVLGAIVRYKIPALPFLVVMCLVCMQPWISSVNSSLKNRIKKKNQPS